MIKVLYDRLLRPVLSAHDSPEAVAGGVALGLGIALTPTMGIQMPIAWLVATLCGANRVVAMAMVWISNPLTVAPMYYSEYLLGTWLLGRDAVTSYHDFQGLWGGMAEQGYLDRIRALSDALLLPLVVGSFVPSLLLGAAAYPASLWSVRRYRRRVSRKPVIGAATGQETSAAPRAPPLDKQTHIPGPKAQAGVLLIAGLVATSGCMDGNGPLTRPGVPAETSAAGTRQVWSGQAGGTCLLLSPFHASAGQDDFTVERFEKFLDSPAGTHRFLALSVFQFNGDGSPAALGRDGIPLSLGRGEGRWSSRKPSSLLAGETIRNRGVLSSLLGATDLPGLSAGQSLRLLVALPGEVEWDNLDSVTVSLPGRDVSLEVREVEATELRLLMNEPRKDVFDALLGGDGA